SLVFVPRAFADDDLNVTIELDGKKLVFAQSAGKDLGDYKTNSFTQRCLRTDIAGSPLTVFFRPDRDGGRVEIVVELGRMWGKANQDAKHLGAYRAVIRQGSSELAAIDVPRHWWFSRWRWQSAPRPIIRSAEELIKAKLIPPYASSAATFAEPAEQSASPTYAGPMDTGGLQTSVGAAGERLELGPVTEFQADYLISGRDASLAALRAQAEAAASMPMHMRDEKTNAPVDFFQYPGLDWYQSEAGTPWVKATDAMRDASGQVTCDWGLDSSHDPALNYVPFLLTDDPFHLEELQFQGNQTLGWTGYHRSENKLQIVYPGETRSFAWSMRTMFQLAKVTPETTPQWLKPRSYWKHIVDDNLNWFTKHYVDNPAPPCSVFHAGTQIDDIAGWQEDFVAFCLGWGVLLGFEEWRKAYRWKLGATLARTDGKSGWPRQWCAPYYMSVSKGELANAMYADRSPPDIWMKSWKEAWDAFSADPKRKVEQPFPDTTSWAQDNSPDYLIYTRAVLALATHLGIAEAREPYEFVNRMADGVKYMNHKWAVAPA
ncbi:MAG: hypothetical protein K8S25_11305, partial [Alphaproteobacteria bacterium]|nr:hypothetical protein [Alphaproteobacteria bacterium]